MNDLGTKCRDVRTREVGIQEIHHKVKPYEVELIRRDYFANDGWETFLSYEDPDQDILVGLLRLRKPSEDVFRPELKGGVSIGKVHHILHPLNLPKLSAKWRSYHFLNVNFGSFWSFWFWSYLIHFSPCNLF